MEEKNINDFNINKFQEYIENGEYETAAEYVKPYAENNNVDAMIVYSDILWRGVGVKGNAKETEKYFTKITENYTNIDNMIKLIGYLCEKYNYYEPTIRSCFYSIIQNGTEKQKNELFNTLNENVYLSTHNWRIYIDFATRLKYGIFIDENKSEAARYYKMAFDKKDITAEAINKYADIIKNTEYIEEDITNELFIYKDVIENCKWDSADIMIEYANMLYNGEGIEKNEEEAIKLYKEAIDKGNYKVLRLNENVNLINELFKYINEKNLKNENIIYDNEQKKDRIKKIKNVNSDETQSRSQVKVDREFYYNKNGELCEMIDKAYHKNNGNLLYEIKYKNNNEKEITYHLDDGIDIIANINADRIIKFDFNNISFAPEELKEKTYKILNSFSENDTRNMRGFSVPLSYLAYAPLQLQIKDEVYNNEVIFDTYSGKDIDNFLDVVNNSFEDENKDKTYIFHFSTNHHSVQMMVNNGDITIFNTGRLGEAYDDVVDQIKRRFDKKVKKIEKTERKINIYQYRSLGQEVGNCVVAPIFAMSNFLMEKLQVREDKFNSIPKNLNDFIEKETKYKNESKILENLKEEHIEIMKLELSSQILNYENNGKAFLTLHADLEKIVDKLYEAVRERDKNNEYVVDSIIESDKKIKKTEKERLENTFNKLLMIESFFKDHGKERNGGEVNL